MSILFYGFGYNESKWIKELKKKFKNIKIVILKDKPDFSKIECAILWGLPDNVYQKLTNVKLLFSLGAGVDHILNMPSYNNVPIVRLKDNSLVEKITNHVLSQILNYQLDLAKYINYQKKRQWKDNEAPAMNADICVGILGAGFLGSIVGNCLVKLGYKVQGYKKTKPKKKYLISIFYKKKDLSSFIKKSDIIVSILPSTVETFNFINKDFLKSMKKKSLLINVGRGASIHEKNLISHLKKNKQFYVSLDVFKKEPLPKNHPFWKLSNVTITPHRAALTEVNSAVEYIFKKYQIFEKNNKLRSDVDIKKGY